MLLKNLSLKTLCIIRKKSIRESDLSKGAPATLLKSLSVMVDFLTWNTTERLFLKLDTQNADTLVVGCDSFL